MSLGNTVFKGFVWSAFERISVQAVQFVLGIILARILTPREYGLVGILLIFIQVASVFVEGGFTKALIQKQDRNQTDLSTVFFFNIGISVLCYLLLWLFSPVIAEFYDEPELVPLLYVLSTTIVLSALYAIPLTLLTIKLDFKRLTIVNITATLLSGGIAVYLAYNGFGVWALVYQSLLRGIFTLFLMWWMANWAPSKEFSWASLRTLFKYGSNLLASSLLNIIVNNFSSFFIAKLMSTKDLGYYTRGMQFASTAFNVINSSLNNVLLPGLSRIQDQSELLVAKMRIIMKTTSLFVFPFFVLLAVVAKPLIILLLTEKWLPAVPIMQMLCLARLITIMSGLNINLLYILGRTDLALRQQYPKIAVRILFLMIGLQYGIVAVAVAELVSTSVHFFINTFYPGRIMKFGAFAQLRELTGVGFSTLLMGGVAYYSMRFFDTPLERLLVPSGIGVITYIILIMLFEGKFLKEKLSAIKYK